MKTKGSKGIKWVDLYARDVSIEEATVIETKIETRLAELQHEYALLVISLKKTAEELFNSETPKETKKIWREFKRDEENKALCKKFKKWAEEFAYFWEGCPYEATLFQMGNEIAFNDLLAIELSIFIIHNNNLVNEDNLVRGIDKLIVNQLIDCDNELIRSAGYFISKTDITEMNAKNIELFNPAFNP